MTLEVVMRAGIRLLKDNLYIRMPVRMGCDPMQCIDGYVGHSEYICRQCLGDMQLTYLMQRLMYGRRGFVAGCGVIVLSQVLEMEEAPIPDNELPLILGRPFMATAKTKIDVEQGTL
ncbi:unnamed protein product, partial [Prunus brigantina]